MHLSVLSPPSTVAVSCYIDTVWRECLRSDGVLKKGKKEKVAGCLTRRTEPFLPLHMEAPSVSSWNLQVSPGKVPRTWGQRRQPLQSWKSRGTEVTQSVKCLPCKHEDLRPTPRACFVLFVRSQAWHTHLSSQCKEVRTDRSLGSLASQHSLLVELWANKYCKGGPISRHGC